jgi:hypothetical protein
MQAIAKLPRTPAAKNSAKSINRNEKTGALVGFKVKQPKG